MIYARLFVQATDVLSGYVMVYTFYCANSHLEMKLNDITIVCAMVQDVYTITNNDLIPPKMADTNIDIWYWCISNTKHKGIKCYTRVT